MQQTYDHLIAQNIETQKTVMTKLLDINFFPPTHSSIFDMIREVKGDLQDIPIILVGNKCDENDTREVPQAEGEAQVIKSVHLSHGRNVCNVRCAHNACLHEQ